MIDFRSFWCYLGPTPRSKTEQDRTESVRSCQTEYYQGDLCKCCSNKAFQSVPSDADAPSAVASAAAAADAVAVASAVCCCLVLAAFAAAFADAFAAA